MSPELLEQRKPVWVALSDLYLDVELQESDFAHIAAILRNAGLNWAEAQSINVNEVAPVVIHNLFAVAGVWTGFDEEQLYAMILRRRRPPRLLGSRRLWRYFVERMLADCLPRLRHCLAAG